jgi:hypothetical protein
MSRQASPHPSSAKKPANTAILKVLADNWQQAGWQQTGTGHKNAPRRYWKPKAAENDCSPLSA